MPLCEETVLLCIHLLSDSSVVSTFLLFQTLLHMVCAGKLVNMGASILQGPRLTWRTAGLEYMHFGFTSITKLLSEAVEPILSLSDNVQSYFLHLFSVVVIRRSSVLVVGVLNCVLSWTSLYFSDGYWNQSPFRSLLAIPFPFCDSFCLFSYFLK